MAVPKNRAHHICRVLSGAVPVTLEMTANACRSTYNSFSLNCKLGRRPRWSWLQSPTEDAGAEIPQRSVSSALVHSFMVSSASVRSFMAASVQQRSTLEMTANIVCHVVVLVAARNVCTGFQQQHSVRRKATSMLFAATQCGGVLLTLSCWWRWEKLDPASSSSTSPACSRTSCTSDWIWLPCTCAAHIWLSQACSEFIANREPHSCASLNSCALISNVPRCTLEVRRAGLAMLHSSQIIAALLCSRLKPHRAVNGNDDAVIAVAEVRLPQRAPHQRAARAH